MRRISLACIAISDAWPDAPPDGSKRIKLISDNHKIDRQRTVDHDTCIWKTVSFPPLSGSEKKRSHRCSHPKAVGMNRRRDILCHIEYTPGHRKLRTHLHLKLRQHYKLGKLNRHNTVSYIASPAVTLPPGELIYRWIGFEESSASKNKSWATMSVESESRI